MNPYEQIRLAANVLSSGESVRGKCPWCHGGRSGEDSFIVTRHQGTALYVCHRASCDNKSKGALSISGAPSSMPIKKPAPKRERVFEWETFELTDRDWETVVRKYGIPIEMFKKLSNLRISRYSDLVCTLYTSTGKVGGVEVRLSDPKGHRKTLIYPNDEFEGMAFYKHALWEKEGYRDEIILVEDVFSAMKASRFMDSASLMGTSFNSEQAKLLADMNYKRVWLALDADASAKAVNLHKRHRVLLPQMRVILLEQDIKNMKYKEIGTLLYENSGRK
jgi:hypothetical protein